MQRIVAALVVLVLIAAGAWFVLSRDAPAPFLVEDAVAVPMHGTGFAVHLKLTNSGGPDAIVAVASPEAEAATLVGKDGSEALPLPLPGPASALFASDGVHLALTGLSGIAEEGALVPVQLRFASGGEIAFKARIDGTPEMVHGMAGLEAEAPLPALDLTVTPEEGGGYLVHARIANLRLARDLADGPHEAGTGHGHVYLNGLKLGRLYEPEFRVAPLPPGRHEISVALNTNDHRVYLVGGVPLAATVVVEVE